MSKGRSGARRVREFFLNGQEKKSSQSERKKLIIGEKPKDRRRPPMLCK